MMKYLAAGLVLSTLAFAPYAAIAATAAPAMLGTTSMGKLMVDAHGMTLYTYDKDKIGKSTCVGQCAVEWPPLTAARGAKASGAWTLAARADGSKVWAYKGHALYTFKEDKKAGDVTGDGKDGFHVVK